jgi:nucleoside-diphosphate-sugar epimerase
MNTKILVIGSGFIATPIINHLISSGHELVVYSRRFHENLNCRQIIGDIHDADCFEQALRVDPEVVIQTAWVTKPNIYEMDPSNSNYAEFTISLAKRLLQTNTNNLIVLGSCAEYGKTTIPCVAGKTELLPENFYGKEKVRTYRRVQNIANDTNLRITWPRIFYPYGPGQDKSKLMPYLMHNLRNHLPITLRDTSTLNDWISVRDISSAISWIIEKKLGGCLDIGTTKSYSNIQILKELESLIGTEARLQLAPNPSDFSFNKFEVGVDSPIIESGWKPCDDLRSGLEWTISNG